MRTSFCCAAKRHRSTQREGVCARAPQEIIPKRIRKRGCTRKWLSRSSRNQSPSVTPDSTPGPASALNRSSNEGMVVQFSGERRGSQTAAG